jgi:hypothetical protein
MMYIDLNHEYVFIDTPSHVNDFLIFDSCDRNLHLEKYTFI